MTQPTTNHELLQTYIYEWWKKPLWSSFDVTDILMVLRQIQFRLIEPVEYKDWDNIIVWEDASSSYRKAKFLGYRVTGIFLRESTAYKILPIPNENKEVSSAITLLEKEGYTITKTLC